MKMLNWAALIDRTQKTASLAYSVFSVWFLRYLQIQKIPRNTVRKRKKKAFAGFRVFLDKQQTSWSRQKKKKKTYFYFNPLEDIASVPGVPGEVLLPRCSPESSLGWHPGTDVTRVPLPPRKHSAVNLIPLLPQKVIPCVTPLSAKRSLCDSCILGFPVPIQSPGVGLREALAPLL